MILIFCQECKNNRKFRAKLPNFWPPHFVSYTLTDWQEQWLTSSYQCDSLCLALGLIKDWKIDKLSTSVSEMMFKRALNITEKSPLLEHTEIIVPHLHFIPFSFLTSSFIGSHQRIINIAKSLHLSLIFVLSNWCVCVTTFASDMGVWWEWIQMSMKLKPGGVSACLINVEL